MQTFQLFHRVSPTFSSRNIQQKQHNPTEAEQAESLAVVGQAAELRNIQQVFYWTRSMKRGSRVGPI